MYAKDEAVRFGRGLELVKERFGSFGGRVREAARLVGAVLLAPCAILILVLTLRMVTSGKRGSREALTRAGRAE